MRFDTPINIAETELGRGLAALGDPGDLDLEISLSRPVFVDQPYALDRELVGLGQSRRTESYWTKTTISDPETGTLVATVLLPSGVFKESYPGYPTERLS